MKYKKKILFKESVLFLMVFCVIIMLQSGLKDFYSPLIRNSPSGMTNYMLNTIARIIEENADVPPEHASRKELRQWICDNGLNIYLPNSEWRPEKYFDVPNNTYDFFGNPLNIDYIGNFPQNISINKFKKLKYNIVIWSSGLNGIDEWGQGDDIVYNPYLTSKLSKVKSN